MSDALVRALNRLGYQPVFLPRTGVHPPEVYGVAEKRLVRHGPLQAYVPVVAKLHRHTGSMQDIEGHRTSGKNGSASVKFLERALTCIGVIAPNIDLGASGRGRLCFSFTDVTYEAVDPVEITRALRSVARGALPAHLLQSGTLHIAYEYAFAKKLRISRADDETAGADLRVSLEGLDSSGKFKISAESKSSVLLESTETTRPSAFAYKAGLVLYGEEGWEVYPEVVNAKMGNDGGKVSYVPIRGVPIEVIDAEASA